MGISAAQITTDIAGVFSDLSDTGCAESVTIYKADGSTERGTDISILRANVLSGRELNESGWENQYKFSVYMQSSDDPGVNVDDVVGMSDGNLRVLNIHTGPLTLYMRLDLGGLYGDEA